jgi:hypothetical protein
VSATSRSATWWAAALERFSRVMMGFVVPLTIVTLIAVLVHPRPDGGPTGRG